MKIGFLTRYFHPIKGGAENYILNLALQAAKNGHDVHVFTTDRKGREVLDKKEVEYKGIKIHRRKTWFGFGLYFYFAPSLCQKVLGTEVDVLHVSSFGFIWHDLILVFKRLLSSKTIFINTPHGPFMALSDYNLLKRGIKWIYTNIQKFFLNWLYDMVLQVNTFQWQWIGKYGIEKDKIHYVPNGVSKTYVQRDVSADQQKNFRQKYDLENKFIISTLSRIDKYKGFQHVIRSLPSILKNKNDLVYLVMGRDEGYLRNLKVLSEKMGVREHVKFIENIGEKEKFVGLSCSEIFIFPSQWEAFGIVLLEAMTQGNALVSTKTEGGKYLVTDKVNGFLYDYGDLKALQHILSKILADREMIAKMQKLNKEKVKDYTWENIFSEKYEPLLESVS